MLQMSKNSNHNILGKKWECNDLHIRPFQEKNSSFRHDPQAQDISSDSMSYFSNLYFLVCWLYISGSLHMTALAVYPLEPSSLSSGKREAFFFTVCLEYANFNQWLFLNNHCTEKVENIPEPNHNGR